MASSSKTSQLTNLSDRVGARGSVDPAEIDHKSGQASQKTSVDPREHNTTVESRAESHHNTYSTVTKGNQIEESSDFTKAQKIAMLSSVTEEEKREHFRIHTDSKEEDINSKGNLIGALKFSLSTAPNVHGDGKFAEASGLIGGLKFGGNAGVAGAFYTMQQSGNITGLVNNFVSERASFSFNLFNQHTLSTLFFEKTRGSLRAFVNNLDATDSKILSETKIDLVVNAINRALGIDSPTFLTNNIQSVTASVLSIPIINENTIFKWVITSNLLFDRHALFIESNNSDISIGDTIFIYNSGEGVTTIVGTPYNDTFINYSTSGSFILSNLTGSDYFLFVAGNANFTITSFDPVSDRIDIGSIVDPYPNTIVGLSTVFFDNIPNQIIWHADGNDTIVRLDIDGDSVSDWSIRLSNLDPSTLNIDSFVLGAFGGSSAPAYIVGRDTVINTGSESRLIFTTDAALTPDIIITGTSGDNTLTFTDTTSITVSANQFANVRGVNKVNFYGDAELTLNGDMVASALARTITINNYSNALSLNLQNLTDSDRTIIAGSGMVTLLSSGTVYGSEEESISVTTSSAGGNTVVAAGLEGSVISNNSTIGSDPNTFVGSEGEDQFVFLENSYSLIDSGSYTIISEFNQGESASDVINIIQINYRAPITVLGNTDTFSNTDYNELIWYQEGDDTIVAMDFDKDSLADWSIQLSNYSAETLDESHFLLPTEYALTGSFIDFIDTGPYTYTIFVPNDVALSSTDIVTGDAGENTLSFTDDNIGNVSAEQFSGVTGVNKITLNSDLYYLEMNDAMVESALDHTVTIENDTHALQLDTSAIAPEQRVVIGGTGQVTLEGGTIYIQDDIDANILTGYLNPQIINNGTGNTTITIGGNSDLTVNGGDGDEILNYAYGADGNNNVVFDGGEGLNGITLSNIGEQDNHWSLLSGTSTGSTDMGGGVTRLQFDNAAGELQIDDGTTIQFQNVDYIDFH